MLFRKFSNWLIVALLCVLPAAAQTVVRAGTTAVPWAPNISCSPGQFVAASPDNLHVFKAINLTPGSAGNAQPTWNIFAGAVTVDGTCAWQEQGTLGLPGSGGSQSGPPQTLTNCTAAGTTLNEGVEFSTQLINGVTSLCGTTAAAGSISVVGVCQTGCGNAGAAQIAYSGYQPGIFDNQTTQNHYVIPSATNPGQFTDIGATVPASTTENVGIVASTNTGAGTIATIFLAPLSLFARGSSGGSGVVNPPGCANGIAYYPGLGAVISSDCNFTTNGQGDFIAHSGTFNDILHAGYVNFIQGPAPPAAPVNGVQVSVPTSVTGYILQLPGATGTGCLQGNAITGGFQVVTTGVNCGTGSGITTQTNGVNNSSQATLDLDNGTGITVTNTSLGHVRIDAAATSAPQALNPTAPTLTNQNAAGARSITYGVQACGDGPACAYHSTLVTTTIANANASPQVLLSAYGDTLAHYRCFNIYVTADSGARTGVPGLIANCVWKSFIDTGANGNSIAATNTNTTVLDANGNQDPVNPCNKLPTAPFFTDGLPCTPNAMDDEFTYTFGSPGDANSPFWTRVNWGTTTTVLSNGEIKITPQAANAGGPPSWRMLQQNTPGTPWSFVTVLNTPWLNGTTGAGHEGLCVSDGTKLLDIGIGSSGNIDVTEFSNVTTGVAQVYGQQQYALSAWLYFKIQDDGTNLNFSFSLDGIGYTQVYSQLRTSFLANTSKIDLCTDNELASTGTFADFDYFRRVQ